jgi:hemerythrin-like metal-binding protein
VESFLWDDNFMTGIQSVDDQHRDLVNMINEFASLFSENSLEFSDIETIFERLADYAKYHFDEEETVMQTAGLDSRHFNTHKEIHQGFLSDITYMHD